jgi:hypothetical protein
MYGKGMKGDKMSKKGSGSAVKKVMSMAKKGTSKAVKSAKKSC